MPLAKAVLFAGPVYMYDTRYQKIRIWILESQVRLTSIEDELVLAYYGLPDYYLLSFASSKAYLEKKHCTTSRSGTIGSSVVYALASSQNRLLHSTFPTPLLVSSSRGPTEAWGLKRLL